MEVLRRALALGIVQGLTEFLPISSSGHLIITRELFGWDFANDLTFDVALHLGTTLALLVYFWQEGLLMLRGGLRWAMGDRDPTKTTVYGARLLSLLAIGSLPAAVVGLIFDNYVEEKGRSPLATPVIVGAGTFKLGEALTSGVPSGDIGTILVGAAVAAAVGWLAIHSLLRLGPKGHPPPVVAP